MKLIITGATGFVATEVVRQSLQHPGITKVVAVSRKPVVVPEGIDGSKLENVTVEEYDEYPPAVRDAFAGADACIWTVAVNFNKTGDYADQEAVREITQDYTMEGLKAMHEAKTNKPFRFLYLSGSLSQRDQSQAPLLWSEYRLMRGEGENQILRFAEEHKGDNGIEAIVAMPGIITTTQSVLTKAVTGVASLVIDSISLGDLATALIDQAVNGLEKDPLSTSDLNRIAKAAKA